MSYVFKPTKFFLQQLDKLSDKAKEILRDKLKLVKENPGRNKRIQGYNLFLFRIRFSDKSKEKRVIYMLEKNEIILLCILDRGNEYKDLKRYLKNLGYL